MKVLFATWANSDRTEGRGRDIIYYVCSNRPLAEEFAKGLGPMGGSDGYVKELYLMESLEDINLKPIAELKAKALEKLTEEEKIVLGLVKSDE